MQISMHPVAEAERRDETLGTSEDLLEHRRALLGRGVGEQLDLVEVVHPQHAPRVPARRPGLAPVARREGHEPHRQVRLGEHLVAMERRERHLGGRHRPEVVALDRVRVVGELGQLARGGQRVGEHEARGTDLLERVGVAVQGQLAQRPGERGTALALHREHRARDLHRPLVVEDAVAGAELPVRDALVLAVGLLVDAHDPEDGVVGLAGAVGRVGVRECWGCRAGAGAARRRAHWRSPPAPAPGRRAPGSTPGPARPPRPCLRAAAHRPASTAPSPGCAARRARCPAPAGGRRGRWRDRSRTCRSPGGPARP